MEVALFEQTAIPTSEEATVPTTSRIPLYFFVRFPFKRSRRKEESNNSHKYRDLNQISVATAHGLTCSVVRLCVGDLDGRGLICVYFSQIAGQRLDRCSVGTIDRFGLSQYLVVFFLKALMRTGTSAPIENQLHRADRSRCNTQPDIGPVDPSQFGSIRRRSSSQQNHEKIKKAISPFQNLPSGRVVQSVSQGMEPHTLKGAQITHPSALSSGPSLGLGSFGFDFFTIELGAGRGPALEMCRSHLRINSTFDSSRVRDDLRVPEELGGFFAIGSHQHQSLGGLGRGRRRSRLCGGRARGFASQRAGHWPRPRRPLDHNRCRRRFTPIVCHCRPPNVWWTEGRSRNAPRFSPFGKPWSVAANTLFARRNPQPPCEAVPPALRD